MQVEEIDVVLDRVLMYTDTVMSEMCTAQAHMRYSTTNAYTQS